MCVHRLVTALVLSTCILLLGAGIDAQDEGYEWAVFAGEVLAVTTGNGTTSLSLSLSLSLAGS